MAWDFPLISPLKFSIIWTTIIQKRIPCSRQKHNWEICALKHLKVDKYEQTREEGSEKTWDTARDTTPKVTAQSSLGISTWRGEESGCCCSLQPGGAQRYSEHSHGSGQYTLRLNLVTLEGTKHRGVAKVVWQSPYQTEKQNHRAWPLPLTVGPRRICNSECQVTEHIICKPVNWYYRIIYSWATGTLQLISGSGRDTEGRLLRSAYHCYWENKTKKALTSLPQHTLHPFMAALPAHSGCRRTALGFHRFGTPSSPAG